MKRVLLAFALAISVSACATGATKINMTAPAGKAGVISEAASTKIDVTTVDARPKQDRVGDKRNGYGMVMGSIVAGEAPTTTVERALENVLTANKHTIGAGGDRLELKSTVKTYWLDYKAGLVTVEFFGSIQADVALVDRTSGQTLYTETFDGYYSEKTGGGLSKTWTRIMDAALADFSSKVAMSDGLKTAIEKASAPQTAAAPTPGGPS